jgi:hypothetical protein
VANDTDNEQRFVVALVAEWRMSRIDDIFDRAEVMSQPDVAIALDDDVRCELIWVPEGDLLQREGISPCSSEEPLAEDRGAGISEAFLGIASCGGTHSAQPLNVSSAFLGCRLAIAYDVSLRGHAPRYS